MERIHATCVVLALCVSAAVGMQQVRVEFPRAEGRSYALNDVDDFYDQFTQGESTTFRTEEVTTQRPNDAPAVPADTASDSAGGGSVVIVSEESQWDRDQSPNPGVFPFRSFLQQQPSSPLDRDFDDFDPAPRNDHIDGRTTWILATSFRADTNGSGKVWAVPTSNYTQGFTLIGGLQQPTGLCFDSNHGLLYVCDQAQGTVYQYEITRKGGKSFELASDVVATIAANGRPADCSTDSEGRLYYTDVENNAIWRVEFQDLWAGYVAQAQVFSGDSEEVSAPVAIDVYQSSAVFFINNQNSGDFGLLKELDAGQFRDLVREDKTAWGLAVSRKGAYFSLEDGSVCLTQVWMYTFSPANLLLKTSLTLFTPRGLCYGSDFVYALDAKTGVIARFADDYQEEVPVTNLFRVDGGYWLECING